MEQIDVPDARRLALARAALLKPEWAGFPKRGSRNGRRAREAAIQIIQRFGYLQLDTVSIAGARSHAIVLLSHRFEEIDSKYATPSDDREAARVALERYASTLGLKPRGFR